LLDPGYAFELFRGFAVRRRSGVDWHRFRRPRVARGCPRSDLFL